MNPSRTNWREAIRAFDVNGRWNALALEHLKEAFWLRSEGRALPPGFEKRWPQKPSILCFTLRNYPQQVEGSLVVRGF